MRKLYKVKFEIINGEYTYTYYSLYYVKDKETALNIADKDISYNGNKIAEYTYEFNGGEMQIGITEAVDMMQELVWTSNAHTVKFKDVIKELTGK